MRSLFRIIMSLDRKGDGSVTNIGFVQETKMNCLK